VKSQNLGVKSQNLRGMTTPSSFADSVRFAEMSQSVGWAKATMILKFLAAAFVALLLTMFGSDRQALAASYLVNGSFETGTWGPWVFSGYGNGYYTGERIACATCPYGSPWSPQDGSYYVVAGGMNAGSYLTQTFQDTPGELLTVSGWVLGTGTGGNIKFNFDGTTYVNIVGVPLENWTEYSFNVVATGNDTLQLWFLNNAYGDGLDNFSVTSADTPAVTPLPATWTMMVIGLAGFGFLAYRRKNSALRFA
jgi:hypothetical protein